MNLKKLEPIYIENSIIPGLLSKLAPIDIWAISFGPFVWCKGVLTKQTKRHEAIHFQQQLELLFVFQWILYVGFYIKGLIKYKVGKTAYYESPFEREAYKNEENIVYLESRPRYNWINYIKDPKEEAEDS